MQINNNNQLNFKSIRYHNFVEGEVQNILKKRVKPAELDAFIKRLEESPVQTTIGLSDGSGFDRLDAHLYYQSPYISNPDYREAFSYVEEKKRFNLFKFRPRNFMNRVLSELNTIEETYRIGKYAK